MKLLFINTSGIPYLPLHQLLTQLRIASRGGLILGEHQAMHEHNKHEHACLGRGMANIRAVIWRDIVEV